MSRTDLVKVCGCGFQHTESTWAELPDRKVWHFDELATFEQRRCFCGSHIVIPIRLCEVITGRLAA